MAKFLKTTALVVATGASIVLGVMSLPKIKKAIDLKKESIDLDQDTKIIDVDLNQTKTLPLDADIVDNDNSNAETSNNVEQIEEQIKEDTNETSNTAYHVFEDNVEHTKVKLKELSRIAKNKMNNFTKK